MAPHHWLPRSLFTRLFLTLALGIVVGQLASSVIWSAQIKQAKAQALQEDAEHLAISLAATVNYLLPLPANLRPLVLEQIQEMGGTRFFVSLNTDFIPLPNIEGSQQAVIEKLESTLGAHLNQQSSFLLNFTMPEDVRVYDGSTALLDLPDRLLQQTLILGNKRAPILVVQIPSDGQWLYIATLMPDPYLLSNHAFLQPELLVSLISTLVIVLFLTLALVRWQTQPLKRLSKAAEQFGKGLIQQPLPETGTREFAATAKTFNQMEQRIHRFIQDREKLFTSISHDLKTPITRLKLRAELLDDPFVQHEFEEDLDELELMVKGALQSVKDTEIHENKITIHLDQLLQQLIGPAQANGQDIHLSLPQQPIVFAGKPLAIRRCLGNLIDNALCYGQSANIEVKVGEGSVWITIADRGPGIPESKLAKIFSPYSRLDHGRQRYPNGTGLGLGIARNIAHSLGGELTLSNQPKGGLLASVGITMG